MNKIKKEIIFKFILSIVLTIALLAGIFGIIFGATKPLTALLVVGIIGVVLGFYGMPIAWIQFAEKKSLKNFLSLIVEEKITKVNELATQANTNENDIINKINLLIQGGYLKGFLFKDKTELVVNKNTLSDDNSSTKCPNCSSNMFEKDGRFVCEYCGYVERRKQQPIHK